MRFPLRNLSLRRRLLLLAAAGVFPFAIFAALAGMELVAERRHEAQRAALELSRAIALAIRGELRNTVAELDGMAVAADLGNPEAFARVAQHGMAEHANWRAVVLTDAEGNALGLPTDPTAAPPRVVDRPSLEQAIETRRAIVGNIVRGPGGHYAVAVRLPVVREGKLRFVISVAVKPDGFLNILSMQKVPLNWVVAVLDAHGNIVARSRAHEANVGRSASPSLNALLVRTESEGFEMTETLEGTQAYTGVARLRDSGWTVAVGIPADEVDGAAIKAATAYGVGIIFSLMLSALLALSVAKGISDPVVRLRRSATAFGRGEPIRFDSCGIAEIDDVGRALVEAAAERTRIEREKETLRLAEHEALQRAQAASRTKDEFLAMLGHELRNPLAPMVTTLELMRMRADKVIEPQLQILDRQVRHMTRLVDDLLDVSRITAGRIELDIRPVELNNIIERALEAVAPIADKRKRPIDILEKQKSIWVAGDNVRLVQVVTNLLTNALKFTPTDRAISVETDQVNDRAILRVSDEGIGISAELLPQLFDLFTQGLQPSGQKSEGLGLGLAIVHNLVTLHGGTVTAHSDGHGKGSTFVVTLPVVAPETDSDRQDELAGQSTSVPNRAANILIVDDNKDAADALAVGLRIAGYSVRCAYDAESALRAFAMQRPDLAICDIGLPTLSGYELADEIRRNPAWASCCLVALTGYGQQTDRKLTAEAGFAAHLVKPVEIHRVEQVIASLLG